MMLLYYVLNLTAIYSLSAIYPSTPFDYSNQTSVLFYYFSKMSIASIAILSIQFFVSLLVHNFIFPIGFGVFATIANAVLMRWEHSHYIPYSYPFFSIQGMFGGEAVPFFSEPVILSLLVGSALFIVGYLTHLKVNIK
jgi:hypothetical protein